MKVLIVGGGGREHALAWKSMQSEQVSKVFVAPGNAGTAMEPGVQNVNIDAEDLDKLLNFALTEKIDLTIIGPEVPLVKGITDLFQENNLQCFGPRKIAAQLEGSKTFSKEFLVRHKIPTAKYGSFTNQHKASEFAKTLSLPMVIKADGLAAGKGVVIAQSMQEAISAIEDMLSGNRFGEAGHRVVVEEYLEGEEASFICMVDGLDVLPMASSQDHKAAYDGDTGPNTGGMGAYSPAPVVDKLMHQRIMDDVITPTVNGLKKDGINYTGFLYAGLMIGSDGVPRVLEFNCRFGDPETQPIMMRMESDLIDHCLAAVQGRLGAEQARWNDAVTLGVVLAAENYPNDYRKGDEIFGLDSINDKNLKVFHAGTIIQDKKVLTSGGRVLCVTALGNDIEQAMARASKATSQISWLGCWFRTDIGHKAIKRL